MLVENPRRFLVNRPVMNISTMNGGESPRVVFPAAADGRRSTSALGRAVVADALRGGRPGRGARRRARDQLAHGYLGALPPRWSRRGCSSREAALTDRPRRAGLAARPDAGRRPDGGTETGLDGAFTAARRRRAGHGHRAPGTGEAGARALAAVPGQRLRGDDAAPPARRLGRPPASSSRPAPRRCARSLANPDWLDLPGRARRGARRRRRDGPADRAAALGRPTWSRSTCRDRRSGGGVLAAPHRYAGACTLPVPAGTAGATTEALAAGGRRGPAAPTCPQPPTGCAGSTAGWCWATTSTPTAPPTCGSPAPSTRSPCACRPHRDDVALAFLATPTDVFAVPAEAVGAGRPRATRPLARRQRSAGRCGCCPAGGCCAATTRPAPTPASTTAWCRSRARTTRSPSGCSGGGRRVARDAGATVSLHVAPPTRTRSVVQEPGAGGGVRRRAPVRRRGVRAGHEQHADGGAAGARPAHRRRPGARAAVAGRGVRRGARRAVAEPYAPRSALGLAVLLGYGAARAYRPGTVAARSGRVPRCGRFPVAAGLAARFPRAAHGDQHQAGGEHQAGADAPPRSCGGRVGQTHGVVEPVGQRRFGDQQVGHRADPAERAAEHDGGQQAECRSCRPRLRSRARVPPGSAAVRPPRRPARRTRRR